MANGLIGLMIDGVWRCVCRYPVWIDYAPSLSTIHQDIRCGNCGKPR